MLDQRFRCRSARGPNQVQFPAHPLLLQDRAAEKQLDLQKAAVASIGANEALAGRWCTLASPCAEAREGGRRLRRGP